MNVPLIVEPESFFNLFVPKPTLPLPEKKAHHRPSNPFTNMAKPTTERKMYEEYPELLDKITRGSGYVFVATPYNADNATNSELAFECGMYPHTRMLNKDQIKGMDPAANKDFRRVCWSGIDLPVECIVEDGPFDNVDIKQSLDDKQVLSSIELIYQHQHRTFAFMLVFIGVHCRLLRVDRSGLIVTKPFDITTTDYLVEFLLCYTQLSPEDRGHDTTAEYINPSPYDCDRLARMMKDHLLEVERTLVQADGTLGDGSGEQDGGPGKRREDTSVEEHIVKLWKEALDEKWPWWKLRVTDETGRRHCFLTGKPSFQAPGILRRGTLCHTAVGVLTEPDGNDTLAKDFVFLKDCWRVVVDGSDDERADMQPEGKTLERLNKANVRHVPTLVVHGDVPGQETKALEAWKKVKDKQSCPMEKHQHYRLVVKEIGKSLSTSKNSGQLILAMHDCLQAHSEAYKTGIMHRDISGGNILLYKDKKGDWRGMLIDWELADVFCKDSTPKQTRRKARPPGTARFSAVRILDSPSQPIYVADEIESVFHVLVYYSVRFLQHNLPDKSVDLLFQKYFDVSSGVTPEGELMAPALKRSSMELGRISLRQFGIQDTLRFMWIYDPPKSPLTPHPSPDYNHPMNDLLNTLLRWFSARYTLEALNTTASIAPVPAPAKRHGEVAFPFDVDKPKPSISSQELLPPERRKTLEDLAAKLEDHKAVLKCFKRACMEEYPRDKGEDKRPEMGHAPRSPEAPGLSEICGFPEFGPGADVPNDHIADASAVAPDAFAELAADGVRDGCVASETQEDELECCERSRSPSSCPSRPKRAREEDAVLGTFGKRNRC